MARIRARNSMISGLLLALLAGTSAFAQCPKYRIVNLGSLGTNQHSEAWAINDMGQVVGQSNTDAFGVMHAFFWDNAGCVGNCMKDLGTLPNGTTSIAYDVNNNSEIVGVSNAVVQGVTVTRATYWAAPFPASPQDLGTLSIDANAFSRAYGINDQSVVVGETDTDITCPEDLSVELVRAFRKQQPTGAMTLLAPIGGYTQPNRNSAAFAINLSTPPPEGFGSLIAGEGLPCGATNPFCGPTLSSGDSLAWNTFGVPPVLDLAEPPTFGDGRGQARDVNNQDRLVGWGRQQGAPGGQPPCHDRALFWQSVIGVPVDLHAAVQLPGDEESVAEALNELGEVVGFKGILPGGARACTWSLQGGQWTFADLNDEINGSCLGSGRWDLDAARDVNESGWIVGKGVFDNTSRAFLLIPIATCLWDIGGSGLIDVQDLLFLLATWGPCNPPNGICLADFDCSGDVGQTDLNELLARWNMTCSQLCGGSAAAAGGSSGAAAADFEETIVMLGFFSIEDFSAWMDAASESEASAMIEILAALLSP